jgi:hypothetical protein
MRKIPFFFIAVLLSLFINTAAWADTSAHLSRGLNFCGEEVQLQQNDVYQAVDQNLVLLSESKSRVWLALKRSGRFLPVVEAELKRAGVPADLQYIPFAITGFDPIYSGGGGRGLWRLRESDARALGLRIDKDVDQRLDPTASSAAAARRLAALKNAYGSWTTAMAAYLIGDDAMREAVSAAGGESNYYKIYLPGGEDNLPSMVLAGKIVFSNPAAFGYRADSSRLWPPYSKRATVDAETSARALAAQYNMDYKSFRDLNPHLISGQVPAGISINLP